MPMASVSSETRPRMYSGVEAVAQVGVAEDEAALVRHVHVVEDHQDGTVEA